MDTRDLIKMLENCSEVKPDQCENCQLFGEENCQEKLMSKAAWTLRKETGLVDLTVHFIQ